MTPPNKLEQLAEFQDAIQSNKGLERLRAMQYLQQMNNQGIMGLPQVQQQPVVQRQDGRSIGSGLSGGRKVFNNLDEATAANLPPNSEFFIVDDPDLYFVDATGAIGKEVQEGTAGGIDAYTAEDIEDGTVTEEKAIAYRNYLRDLEQSNQDRPQFDRRKIAEQGGLDWVANANGGPVVNKWFGGNLAPQIFSELKKQGVTPTGSTEGDIVYTGTSDGRGVSATATRVPFMGGSGVAYPDPNVSQEEALVNLRNMKGPMGTNVGSGIASMFEQGLMNVPARGAERLANEVNYVEEVDPMGSPQAMNDQIVSTQGENIPFNFGAANFLSNAGGPIPLRENTQQGIRDRATLGGRVETPNMIKKIFSPRMQGGMGGKITDTWGSNEPPQSTGDYGPSPDLFNRPIMPEGFVPSPEVSGVQPMAPGPQIISTGPFINQPSTFGPKVIGMPATPGGPLIAAQGGYIIDLEGNIPTHPAFHGGPIIPRNYGGIVGDSELQQLQEGGLVNLPVVKMGFGGFLRNVFRAPARIIKSVAKGVKGIVKSKAFKALAPLVLAVAAPYALGALAPSVFGAGATFMGGALSTSGALGYGLATGLGSMAGNLLGGARFGDAARQGLLTGATGGIFKGLSSGNWMGTGTGGAGAAGTIGQKGFSKPGSALMDQSKQLARYGPPRGPIQPEIGTKFYGGTTAASQPTQLVYEPVQQGTTVFKDAPGGMKSFTPDPTIVEPKTITPITNTFQAPTPKVDPSTWSQIKQAGTQMGKDIWKDYGNWQGGAKLIGMDMMQPDWDQVYASEDAMENQLREMGYDIVDTGFGTQRVIRDPSGVTLPSNLSVQDILDRALGRTPRTRLVDRLGFEPNVAAQGGLVSLAHGGEFSGMVEGRGHGMQDNVYMPIKEKGHGKQIGTLAVSPSEYVVDAHTMSALGNGNPDAGAEVMDTVIESVRKKAYGTIRQPNEINGLNALMPMMQGV